MVAVSAATDRRAAGVPGRRGSGRQGLPRPIKVLGRGRWAGRGGQDHALLAAERGRALGELRPDRALLLYAGRVRATFGQRGATAPDRAVIARVGRRRQAAGTHALFLQAVGRDRERLLICGKDAAAGFHAAKSDRGAKGSRRVTRGGHAIQLGTGLGRGPRADRLVQRAEGSKTKTILRGLDAQIGDRGVARRRRGRVVTATSVQGKQHQRRPNPTRPFAIHDTKRSRDYWGRSSSDWSNR